MIKKITLFSAIALLLMALPIMAQGEKTAAPATKGEHANFEGTLVCMGCALKKGEGARAECAEFGHKHAIQTEDGKLISLLENKYSADLLKGGDYHNKPIKAHGIFHASANTLDVEMFTIDDQKKGWCDHCKSMDGCPFKEKM
jgi:hypothetical protein